MELISPHFMEIVWEFTTGQNSGSEKFTNSCACVVTAVCLHRTNIFLFFFFQEEKNNMKP